MTNYDDEPTKVEKLLSEINNTESLFIAVLLNPCLFRLPIQTYAKVVVIENLLVLKTSKNKVINDLLEIAFDQIYPFLNESQNMHLIIFTIFLDGLSQANYD